MEMDAASLLRDQVMGLWERYGDVPRSLLTAIRAVGPKVCFAQLPV
jgi:hypothetical protein